MVSIIERLTPWRDVRASLRTRATADRVRYVGELVAMVVATDRYHAEDAADLVAVDYAPLGAVVDPVAALDADAPVLHPSLGSNLINVRRFRYGNPKAAFEVAPHRIGISVAYPRSACTPIETYGVIASYEPGEDTYDVTANFQGPFSIHAVVARSLNVPGNRLRLRTPPDPGGSFAIKQGVFPYMILAGIAARIAGAPVSRSRTGWSICRQASRPPIARPGSRQRSRQMAGSVPQGQSEHDAPRIFSLSPRQSY